MGNYDSITLIKHGWNNNDYIFDVCLQEDTNGYHVRDYKSKQTFFFGYDLKAAEKRFEQLVSGME